MSAKLKDKEFNINANPSMLLLTGNGMRCSYPFVGKGDECGCCKYLVMVIVDE